MSSAVSPEVLDSYAKLGLCSNRAAGLILFSEPSPSRRGMAISRVQRDATTSKQLRPTITELLRPDELQLPDDRGFIQALLRSASKHLNPRAAYLLAIKYSISPQSFRRLTLSALTHSNGTIGEYRVYHVSIDDIDQHIAKKLRNGKKFKTLYVKDLSALRMPTTASNEASSSNNIVSPFEKEIFLSILGKLQEAEDRLKLLSQLFSKTSAGQKFWASLFS